MDILGHVCILWIIMIIKGNQRKHWTIETVNIVFLVNILMFNKEPILNLTFDWHALMSCPCPSRFIHLKYVLIGTNL